MRNELNGAATATRMFMLNYLRFDAIAPNWPVAALHSLSDTTSVPLAAGTAERRNCTRKRRARGAAGRVDNGSEIYVGFSSNANAQRRG